MRPTGASRTTCELVPARDPTPPEPPLLIVFADPEWPPARAGSVQLAAGEYSLRVQGSNAIFTNVDTGKSFTTAVKSEDAGKKFNATAVDTSSKDGTDQITAIELGGSSTKLELGE